MDELTRTGLNKHEVPEKLQIKIDSCLKALNLDDSQREAINFCLCRKIAIVQGPPGTGKTTFAQALLFVLVWLAREGDEGRVLLTASGNVLVDNLLDRFRSDCKHQFASAFGDTFSSKPVVVRRYGNNIGKGYEEKLKDIHLETISKYGFPPVSDPKKYAEEFKRAELVGGTLGSLALGTLIPSQKWSTVVAEENGQT